MLEYHITGGKYTSLYNNIEKTQNKLSEQEAGGQAGEQASSQKRHQEKAYAQPEERPSDLMGQQSEYDEEQDKDFIATFECVETRRDKLQNRPREFHLISQQQVLADVPVIDKQRLKEQENEKDEQINKLIELSDKFNVKGLKSKILKKTNKAIETLSEQ